MAKNAVTEEIGGLADLDLPALRRRWAELYRSEPALRMSREFLIQAIAYRLHENAHGGLSAAARARLSASQEPATSNRARIDRSVKTGHAVHSGMAGMNDRGGRRMTGDHRAKCADFRAGENGAGAPMSAKPQI